MLSAIDERPPIFIPFGVRVHAGMRSLEGQVQNQCLSIVVGCVINLDALRPRGTAYRKVIGITNKPFAFY